MRHFALVLVVFSLVASSNSVSAQESEREGVAMRAEPDTEVRLRHWLQYRAESSARNLEIAGGFASAAAVTGLGIYGLVDDDILGGAVGRIYLSMGILGFASPIVLLATQNHPELDFQNLPERALTEREIGYYEGLLHSEARMGRALRIGRGIQGAFLSVGGALGFALTLDESGFRDAPIEAGMYLGLGIGGLIAALSAFFKGREERIWEGYSAGVVPNEESARVEFRGDGVRWTF